MNAAIYTRVSTETQERGGTSLETQLAACRAYCQEHGYNIVREYIETYSGLALERPKLEELRETIRNRQIDVLVVHSLDRFYRDPDHWVMLKLELRLYDVSLEAVTEKVDTSDIGELVSYIKGFAAKKEADKIKERTVRGRRARAQAGKITCGGRLYGYVYNKGKGEGQGIRIENPDESKWVKHIFGWYVVDGMSLAEIARKLNEIGVPTPSGKGSWHMSTVHDLIKNPAFVGETYRFAETYKQPEPTSGVSGVQRRRGTRVQRPPDERVLLPNATPPIIAREIFEAAQTKLIRNRERAMRNTRETYLLRGLIVCRRCGKHYWGAVSINHTSKGTSRTRYYHCARNMAMASPRCDNPNFDARQLEAQVWAEVEKIIASPSKLLKEFKARDDLSQKAIIEDKLEQINARLQSAEKRYKADVRLFEWGGIEGGDMKKKVDQWKADKDKYAREKVELEAELAKVHDAEVRWEKIEEFCELVRQEGLEVSDRGKRLALEGLGIEILVDGNEVSVIGKFADKPSVASTHS